MNNISRQALLVAKPPWLLRVTASHLDATTFLWSLQRGEFQQGVVRQLRGKRMLTTGDLFNEFAAALQFPFYFGGNWAAFDECMKDLEWLPAANFVLAVLDCSDLLTKEEGSQLDLLLDNLESVCIEWSKRVAKGESWDRPAAPFHVIFHSTLDDLPRVPPRIKALPEVIYDHVSSSAFSDGRRSNENDA